MVPVAFAVIGALLGCLAGCIPALHVYNLLGCAALLLHGAGGGLPPLIIVPLVAGMITGWSMANSIPSILLGAPDESAVMTVLPGQRLAMSGRGFEAVMIASLGGLAGLFILIAVVAPAAPRTVSWLQTVFSDHYHWIIWVVIVFLLMSEWPRFGTRGQGGLRKLSQGWINTGGGLATFLLSGLLGFVLRYKSPVAVDSAFMNLTPAFAGLFAVPWLMLTILGNARLPEQVITRHLSITPRQVFRGSVTGAIGGMFAAFFPGITGGVGGLLAGHATAQRNDMVFLTSQGASKVIYYVGALLLFFVPGRGTTRGMGAWLMRGLYVPCTVPDYLLFLSAIAVSGAVSFLFVGLLAMLAARWSRRVSFRAISAAALLLVVIIVAASTGAAGLLVMAVASTIGFVPLVFQSRRINCLGIILLPMACSMSGHGETVARWIGLV